MNDDNAARFKGYQPRELNGFEESIVDFWNSDFMAAVLMATMWVDSVARGAEKTPTQIQVLLTELTQVLRSSKNREHSPIAAVEEVRQFMESNGLIS